MKVAIYARYSSDNQRDASIADQMRVCRSFAERQGWTVTEEYSDHAVSGATLLHAGFQSLMRDALNRRFDVALAESLDRFSRHQEDTAGLFERLTFAAEWITREMPTLRILGPSSLTNTFPTFCDVERAATQLAGIAHHTPIATSRSVDARTGAQVFFKCEHFQRGGAFKFRGAYNAMAHLAAEAGRRATGALAAPPRCSRARCRPPENGSASF